jgi:hypothetical protein
MPNDFLSRQVAEKHLVLQGCGLSAKMDPNGKMFLDDQVSPTKHENGCLS